MKEVYVLPEVEMIEIPAEDICTASPCGEDAPQQGFCAGMADLDL